jgi:hypothetical protein
MLLWLVNVPNSLSCCPSFLPQNSIIIIAARQGLQLTHIWLGAHLAIYSLCTRDKAAGVRS